MLDSATGQVRFQRIATERSSLKRLIELERPDVVVFEICTQAGWVYDLCRELGVAAKVANTAAEAWKWKNLKRKTDQDDALRFATLESMGELPTVRIPAQAVRQRRSLIVYRQSIVGRRVAVQNQIRAVFAGQGVSCPVGHRDWTADGVALLDKQSRPVSECGPEELWRGQLALLLQELNQLWELETTVERKLDELGKADAQTQLLETIDGVGRRTAEVVAVYIDDAKRFTSGRQVSSYGGLVPRQWQSGETDRRGRITRRGPSLLRKLLVEAAWCMLRYNGWARQVVARISRGQKTRRKQAIVALARKLLVRCWAMLRDGVPWRDPPSSPAAPPPAT